MNDFAGARAGPMWTPPHLGELIRESMDDVGWKMSTWAPTISLPAEKGNEFDVPVELQGPRRNHLHPAVSKNSRY